MDFLIIAFSIFLFVKMVGKMRENMEQKKKAAEAEAAAAAAAAEAAKPKAPTQEELLAEIRDLLKEKK